MKLNDISDLKKLVSKLNRIATTQALIALNRDYNELDEGTVNNIKDRVMAVYDENWTGGNRQEFWGQALNFINRFWGEHFSKCDDAGKRTIAFPGIAKLLLDNEISHAWNTVVMECIEKSELGEMRVFESVHKGHTIVLSVGEVDYVVSPTGVEVLTEHSDIGADITYIFNPGPVAIEFISGELYRDCEIMGDNYYYRALAVSVGLLDDLKDQRHEDFAIHHNLSNTRNYLVAIEALLIARAPKGRIKYAAPSLTLASGLLQSANFGTSEVISNLIVQSVPFDVPNHRFIADHALSGFARMLRKRGLLIEKHRYPELVALVGSFSVQIVKRSDNDEILVRWDDRLAEALADLIYEFGNGNKGVANLLAKATEYKTLLEDAAMILTVVYKNQIRC